MSDGDDTQRAWDAASASRSRETFARLDALYDAMTSPEERKLTEAAALENYYRIVLDLGIDDPIPEGITFEAAAAQATPEVYGQGVRRLLETVATRNPVHFCECFLRMLAPDKSSLFNFAENFAAAKHEHVRAAGAKMSEVVEKYQAIKMAPHATPQ